MLIAILIIQGIICGFFCHFIAREKGRNPKAWFVLGLLFGIIALITLAAIPSVSTTKATIANVSYDEIQTPQFTCEECGKSEFEWDGFEYSCKNCGWKTL